MGHKIKDFNAKLKTVNEKSRSFGLQERVAGLPDYVPPVMETNSITVDPIFIGRDGVAYQIVDDIIKCSDESEVSIFPKGEKIWRERLIQLWMAEGFLFGSSEKSDMESRGDNVYHFLLQNLFLHEAVKDEHGRIEYSKMHDRVHDLSCLVAGVDRDDEENVISRVRYLAVNDEHGIKKEQAIYLRTLILEGGYVFNNKFLDCKYLHALDLQRTYIAELTSSIDKLIHLRFLDLSYNYIKRLPDSVCKLFNLQTLRLVYCLSLIELPDRFKLLVGLRHLVLNYADYYEFRRMPLEIGKLTSLRTLGFFIVGNEEGHKIGELRNLNNLRGKLVITNLEEVRDKEEAMGANLVEKRNLESLEFKWSRPSSREGNNNDYEVLASLQPPQNIKSLDINNFDGDNFPSWTMRMDLPKLIKIVLSSCGKCQEMPTLGHLPFLKILEVYGLGNVRLIGPSFYQNGDEESSRSSVAFPALERLHLLGMDNLTKWVEAPNTVATAFPKLEHLQICDCRELMTVPSHAFPSLRKLYIRGVESEVPLTKICSSNSGSLEKLVIRENSSLTSFPDTLFYNNRCLRSLRIEGCNNLRQLELSDALKSLGELIIKDCSNLASIQCQTTDYLKDISPISHLEISGCPMLAGLPSEIMLKNLDNGMDCLKTLEIGPFSEETGMNETLKGLRELRELWLHGEPHWESLPDQLQHLTALTELYLYDFGMEALPEWFSNMSSLNSLSVFDCDKLMDLSCLQHLTKLKSLYITSCRLIRRETWTDPSSSVAQRSLRAHISHIPNILVDWEKFTFQ